MQDLQKSSLSYAGFLRHCSPIPQWYMAISQEDKEAIAQAAHERLETTRLLVSADKHVGLLEQARLEGTREMFHAHKGRAR